jgi:hypothetical protein
MTPVRPSAAVFLPDYCNKCDSAVFYDIGKYKALSYIIKNRRETLPPEINNHSNKSLLVLLCPFA